MEFSGIKISIIKAAVIGVVTYFFMYILVSAALFWFDGFSTAKAFLISLVLFVIVIRIITNETRKKITMNNLLPDLKEALFFAGIVAASIILSGSKFGFYGMGQDQGVYQTKAIELMYDNNANELDFEYAVNTLDDPADFKYFRDIVKCLQGYYLIGQSDPYRAEENAGGESGLRGVYHGLPTWPAIMALFGKLFGMSHMQDCQTLFLICYLMIAFYIFENFRIKTICEVAFVAILATSPQMIWVSKSALTEMFLAVIFATFIWLACNENRNIRLLMWIPVAVFSVFHASVYTIMPIFMVIAWINYLNDKRKRAVLPPLMMLVSYYAGFWISIKTATLYTADNYIRPIKKYIKVFGVEDLSNGELVILVSAVVLACILITVLLAVLLKGKKFNSLISHLAKKEGIILKILSFLLIAYVIYMYFKINGGFTYSPNPNVIALSVASGIITVLLAFIGIAFIKPEKISGMPFITIFVLFLYILIWSVLLRPNILYFYYYGRYNVPFLIVIAIFICVVFRDFKRLYWIPFICVASVIIYLDYDSVMMKTPDDTKVGWKVIEKELNQHRIPNSAVILYNDTWELLEWMMILKASGLPAYPYNGNLDSQTDKLLEKYDAVYFMYEGYKENIIGIDNYTNKSCKYLRSYIFTNSEDYVNGTESWSGYPRSFFSEDRKLDIYLFGGQ